MNIDVTAVVKQLQTTNLGKNGLKRGLIIDVKSSDNEPGLTHYSSFGIDGLSFEHIYSFEYDTENFVM